MNKIGCTDFEKEEMMSSMEFSHRDTQAKPKSHHSSRISKGGYRKQREIKPRSTYED